MFKLNHRHYLNIYYWLIDRCLTILNANFNNISAIYGGVIKLYKLITLLGYCLMSSKQSSSLAKGYNPLYSSSPLASLDRFLRSHGDGLYVMQLVIAATNQNRLYKKHMFCRKNVNKIKMRKIVSPARFW